MSKKTTFLIGLTLICGIPKLRKSGIFILKEDCCSFIFFFTVSCLKRFEDLICHGDVSLEKIMIFIVKVMI